MVVCTAAVVDADVCGGASSGVYCSGESRRVDAAVDVDADVCVEVQMVVCTAVGAV